MDACKPGDRVSLVGVYRAVPPRAVGSVSGVFRSLLVACSARQLVRDSGAPPRVYYVIASSAYSYSQRPRGGASRHRLCQRRVPLVAGRVQRAAARARQRCAS